MIPFTRRRFMGSTVKIGGLAGLLFCTGFSARAEPRFNSSPCQCGKMNGADLRRYYANQDK